LDFEEKLQKHVSTGDFGKMDELIQLYTFSTRSESMLADMPELKAENVPGSISGMSGFLFNSKDVNSFVK